MSDISIYVTSDLTSSERKVSPQWSLKYFQERLELITGIPVKFQTIQLYAISNSDKFDVLIDSSTPEAYKANTDVSSLGLKPFCRINVEDSNPDSDLKDLIDSEVKGFEMTEEEYQKRNNTVLKWKQDNKLGRFNPDAVQEKQQRSQEDAQAVETMKVGDRCRVMRIQGERRGTIRFIGEISQLDDGYWVGIEFDEPAGKNNGSIGDQSFFQCKPKHGSFVRPAKVEVGDYPELDLFSDDEEL
ncbi:tubulin-specific chaperone B [[Candida] jaroonii]|uniref:Tubulin-specific chaperone B n=1 Tax=[Candida] jaroonii TaxID=467808 RepID=A0ACA9Y736_9ASCO|nr:tubulin-specific chaperone B [[Candida] jaroonii]